MLADARKYVCIRITLFQAVSMTQLTSQPDIPVLAYSCATCGDDSIHITCSVTLHRANIRMQHVVRSEQVKGTVQCNQT
jgi:hypothetical protein